MAPNSESADPDFTGAHRPVTHFDPISLSSAGEDRDRAETGDALSSAGMSWACLIAAALLLHAMIAAVLVLADRAPDDRSLAKEIPVEIVVSAPEPKKTPPLAAAQEEKQPPPKAAHSEKSAQQDVKTSDSKPEIKAETKPEPKPEPKRAEEPKPKPAQPAKSEPVAAGAGMGRHAGDRSVPGAAGSAPALRLPFDLGPPIFHAVAVPMPSEGDGEAMSYKVIVFGMLERVKHFPDAAAARGAHGASVVVFSLDDAGGVKSVSLFRSSGDPDLDAESVAVVSRAAPFPAPPPGAQRDFAAELTFGMRAPPDPASGAGSAPP